MDLFRNNRAIAIGRVKHRQSISKERDDINSEKKGNGWDFLNQSPLEESECEGW